MRYSDDLLNDIFDRTGGECHLCGRRLAFSNYGRVGSRGAWEVDHSVAQCRGGTHRRNNLYAACISCNRAKREAKTRSVRGYNGMTRAPLSFERRTAKRKLNTVLGAAGGIAAGALLAGPIGAILGGAIGGLIGDKTRPK